MGLKFKMAAKIYDLKIFYLIFLILVSLASIISNLKTLAWFLKFRLYFICIWYALKRGVAKWPISDCSPSGIFWDSWQNVFDILLNVKMQKKLVLQFIPGTPLFRARLTVLICFHNLCQVCLFIWACISSLLHSG